MVARTSYVNAPRIMHGLGGEVIIQPISMCMRIYIEIATTLAHPTICIHALVFFFDGIP